MTLTIEQKEQRKLAASARNRAYHARYREISAAENTGKAEITSRFDHELQTASAIEIQIDAERAAAVNEIDRKIAELQKERQAVQDDFSRRYRAARDVSSEIYSRKRAAEDELEKTLNQQFPDISGHHARYSASSWKPIEEFL